ncbi:DNA primase, partial [Tolypothrix campylonemoides VB511288]
PQLALELQPPFRFASLRQPGIDVLVDVLQAIYQRPDITVGALIEHFEGRDAHHAALQKLAVQTLPGDEAQWRQVLLDAIAQLDRQTLQQRVDELRTKQRDGALDAHDKDELRALLQQIAAR